MKYFLYKNSCYAIDGKLPEGYSTTSILSEQENALYEISEDQYSFYLNNPNATIQEIISMQLVAV